MTLGMFFGTAAAVAVGYIVGELFLTWLLGPGFPSSQDDDMNDPWER